MPSDAERQRRRRIQRADVERRRPCLICGGGMRPVMNRDVYACGECGAEVAALAAAQGHSREYVAEPARSVMPGEGSVWSPL